MISTTPRKLPTAAIVGLGTLLVLLLLGLSPNRAAAATCDTTWVGSNSGAWLDNANWADGDGDPDNNVPGAADNVCITNPGTYTVTIVDNTVFSTGSAKSITVGDGDPGNGTVTLTIAASTSGGGNPQGATLNSLSEESTIATDGVLELTGVGANPGQALIQSTASINNSGVVRSSAGGGGERLFGVILHNLAGGTVDIAYDATQGFTTTWTNDGTFNVANGATFTFTGNGAGPVFNQSGGTIQTNATGTFFQGGGFFNHTGGTTAGTKPIQLCGPQLTAPSGGTGSYDFVRVPASSCGGGSLNGPIGTGKTVRLNNDSNNAMQVSLTGDLANNGTLILMGPSEDQLLGSFTLTNNATLQTTGSGARVIGSSITNSATGTFDVDQDVSFPFTPTITNNGAVDVADGKTMYVTGSGQGPTFNQSAGTIATNTSGVLFMNGGTFNHTGGSQSGNQVKLCGPTLNAPTGGAAAYDFIRSTTDGCGGGSLSGDIGPGKVVRMNNDSNNAMQVSLTTPIENKGTLILTGPSEDQLLGFSTLTNSGLMQIAGSGGRLVGDNITNAAAGTIDVDQDVNFGFTPTFNNAGAIDIAATKTLSLTGSGGGPVYNQTAGTVNVAGTLNHGGGAYTHSGGTTTVAAGGTIQTNGSNIAMTGGTLKGSGSVAVNTLSNTGGTVHPGSSPGILTVSGNYTQGPGGTLAVEIAGTTPGTGYSRLAVGAGATLDGELDVTNTITPAGGTPFVVVNAGGIAGTFATVDVHGIPGYDTTYNPTNVTLTAHSAPAAPSLSGTDPASGANDNTPKVLGSAVAGSTVKLYRNAACTGTPAATATAAQLAAGIEVTVPDNSSSAFRATATNGDGTSSCSATLTYVEDSRPAAPTLTSTDPASPSASNSPKIKGSAPAGSTVKIYTNAACTGTPDASGTAATLAGAGIPVSVADNSTTTFRATATDAGGTSGCSSTSVSYTEDSTAPTAVITKGPKPKTTKKKAKFTFSADGAASFSCQLDSKAAKPCTSPTTYKNLKKGKHTFRVTATDSNGNSQATPTEYKWKVKKKAKGKK